ncbi:MAG: redoxin domain-containing protein [Winogradskyella sp.]|uniref:TlpA family protein disulfide reductase n=1 Tax=Winogradskyella sp. TaxID=1883156 RepID=UPI0017D1AE5C|nr:redoxin domain-containing protein [Winogradskyella sp.]MBT8244386.1 redoxin domain-containing protein [Winogradskyella sp.]NNK23301.1 redoxin domain-containing protein [Winogradskyella sp.]
MKAVTFLFLLLTLSITGCKNSSDGSYDSAFFGGEIINPKGDKVIFYNKNTKENDTLQLDKNNRFSHTINDVNSGVYSFRHGGEIQFVILEPKDSVMLRLNTYDFDGSLVFMGKSARKNNYLIKTFLNVEKESQRLVKYSNMEPEEFVRFIDKRHKRELEEFENFKSIEPISDFANSIIKASIDYHNYGDKEIYPFAYFGENKMVHIKDLPEDFYDFRKKVDYNSEELNEISSYFRYLFFHFDNIAVNHFYSTNKFHSKFNRHELSYNKAKLNLVDSLVEDETLKNRLLKYKTREFINNNFRQEDINEIMASYLSKTTNEEDVKYMNGLIASLDNLKPGKGLPDLKVINVNEKNYTIAEVVNKPTLIYFWSTNFKKHYKRSHYRVKELKAQFPKLSFMSININDNSEKYWKETINQYKFDLNNEYRFENPKEALETLAVNYLYKVIIVDNKANIINPNVNIFNSDFEDTLNNMIQKKELVLK